MKISRDTLGAGGESLIRKFAAKYHFEADTEKPGKNSKKNSIENQHSSYNGRHYAKIYGAKF